MPRDDTISATETFVVAGADAEVVVERLNQGSARAVSVFARVLSLGTVRPSEWAPEKMWRVAVQRPYGRVLWQDVVKGNNPTEFVNEMSEQIRRLGFDEFVFRKNNGLVID